jgi:4-hydroxy-3-polyprenylbenzoate decarboxylase
MRKQPVYVTTVVGIPPMEDYYLGLASERIFCRSFARRFRKSSTCIFPAAGIFHNLVLVSIDKRYPGHARKIMHAFWGLGQLMFSKCIVVVDQDVDVQNEAEVAWIVGTHVDSPRATSRSRAAGRRSATTRRCSGIRWEDGIDAHAQVAVERASRASSRTARDLAADAANAARETLEDDRHGRTVYASSDLMTKPRRQRRCTREDAARAARVAAI